MFTKRQRTYQHDEPNPEKRFRHNMAELFLDNQVSADRVQSLLDDAKLANAQHIGDLASRHHSAKRNLRQSTSSTSAAPKKKVFRKNAARNILKKLLKRNEWPPLYEDPILIFNSKTQQE